MLRTTVLAFGHSHLVALQSGYEAIKSDLSVTLDVHFKPIWGLYHPFVRREGNSVIYNADLEADLSRLTKELLVDVIVGTLIGSEHFAWAVQGQSRPFDVILPFSPELPRVPNAEAIPYQALRRVIYGAISDITGFYARIQLLTGLPVYQVLPPPPVSSQLRVLDAAPQSLREMMLQTGTPHWITRYKLWLLWISVASEIADRDGIELIDPPMAVRDKNGLLLEEYCGDAVHGNDHYGRLIWQQVGAAIQERG